MTYTLRTQWVEERVEEYDDLGQAVDEARNLTTHGKAEFVTIEGEGVITQVSRVHEKVEA